MKKLFTVVLLFTLLLQVNAQDENSKKNIGKSDGYSLLWGGVETSTMSRINTNTGDSNSVGLYLAPYIDYNHKSGFGLRLKSYAFPGGGNPGFYLTSISPYFASYNGKLLPGISYTRYIQHDNPSALYSPIQNEIYGYLRLKTKFIDPVAGVDVGFGTDEADNNKSVSDVNAFFGISHLFLKDNIGANKSDALGIRPGLQLNAGTDRYFKFLRTTKYIAQNTKANRIGYSRGGRPGSSGNGTASPADVYTISEANEFNLSNAEANLYIIYFPGKFSIEPSGSLYFPLRGDDRTPYGYWQINLNYWFK